MFSYQSDSVLYPGWRTRPITQQLWQSQGHPEHHKRYVALFRLCANMNSTLNTERFDFWVTASLENLQSVKSVMNSYYWTDTSLLLFIKICFVGYLSFQDFHVLTSLFIKWPEVEVKGQVHCSSVNHRGIDLLERAIYGFSSGGRASDLLIRKLVVWSQAGC